MTRAVIFVISKHFDPHATRCAVFCEERGYEIVGVVQDRWSAVLRMVAEGKADVIVVSEASHLDPRRSPRIEVVAHYAAGDNRRENRTRILIRRVVAK